MSVEPLSPPRPMHKPRRSLGDRLREALLQLAEGRALIEGHKETSWASITFAGTRHSLTLSFSGQAAVEAGERFIAALPDHEFTIPGQLVADAAIDHVSHALLPQPHLRVCCEVLLLEDG